MLGVRTFMQPLRADQAVVSDATAEFRMWREALPYRQGSPVVPKFAEKGGIPTNWTNLAVATWHVDGEPVSACLARCEESEGGWFIIRNRGGMLTLDLVETTPMYLYEAIRARLVGLDPDAVFGQLWNPIEVMVRKFILSAYDHDDPTEAGYATLVALGGTPTYTPAALL